MPILHAVGLSAAVALLGWALRALTLGGVLAATAVGTAILGGTGWTGMAALGAFFAGSSLVSRLAPGEGEARFDMKGTRRDHWQVLANGGAAALGALVPGGAGPWIVTASLAAAAADTWATSAGGWSRTPPRHILSRLPVVPGTDGGITAIGTAGAAAGALTVGLAAALAAQRPGLIPLGFTVGMVGMTLDSILGAAAQGRFHCMACQQPTGRRVHRCGTPTRRIGGLSWIGNDAVNAIATAAAAGLGWCAALRWS